MMPDPTREPATRTDSSGEPISVSDVSIGLLTGVILGKSTTLP